MNKFCISALIIGSMLFMSNSSCQKDSLTAIKHADFNEPFELALKDSLVLSKNNKGLMISFTDLNDSRCPSDVECIWAGNARVSLKFESQSHTQATATLCIGQCDKQFRAADTALINLQDLKYRVILKEVNPYPGRGNSGTKKAVLIVQQN